MTIRPFVLIVMLAAVLLVDHAALAQDETLGRLFYTARQRAALDANVRSSGRVEKPIPIPRSVTLNGVVTRSDGEQTVWIDGRAYHRTQTGDLEVITRSAEPGMAEIKVRGVPRRQEVRVGQRLDPVSGETFEAFETPPPGTRLPRPATGADSQGAEPASSAIEE